MSAPTNSFDLAILVDLADLAGGDPVSLEELVDHEMIPWTDVRASLHFLRRDGLVDVGGDGRWFPTSSGARVAERLGNSIR